MKRGLAMSDRALYAPGPPRVAVRHVARHRPLTAAALMLTPPCQRPAARKGRRATCRRRRSAG
jgi:hypothetical protein